MKRRLFALLAALLLLSALTSLAEDFEMFDDFGEDTEYSDVPEATEEDIENAKGTLDALSGYAQTDIPVDGDFKLEPLEDKVSCKAIRYIGYEEEVTVPGTLRSLVVTGLYQTFSDCSLLESVILPETVESLENMCFWKCTSLKRVELQEGLKSIGLCSFGGCVALENIEFPESLEKVDDMVFISCISLKELTFGKNLKSIGSKAFYGCASLEKIRVPKGTSIADDAFEDCPKLSEIEYYDTEAGI